MRSVSKNLIKFYSENRKGSSELIRLNRERTNETIFVANERKSNNVFNSLKNYYSLDDPILRIKKSLTGLDKPSEKERLSSLDSSDEKIAESNNDGPNSTTGLIEVGFKRMNSSQEKLRTDNDTLT